MSSKSPAQMLFERIIRTWVLPEVQKRAESTPQDGPIPLRVGLLIWESPTAPTIFLNDQVFGKVETIHVQLAKPIQKNQAVTPDYIRGIDRIKLSRQYWGKPYIYICQGENENYFITFAKISQLKDSDQFKVLKSALKNEGVQLTSNEEDLSVSIDLIKNHYLGTPAQKRLFTLQLKRTRKDSFDLAVTDKIKRHLKLPTFIIHADDEILPLLLEARNTYIDGHFFSCIASSATVADRICINLVKRHDIKTSKKSDIVENTFGQKIERMQSLNLISGKQAIILDSLNQIRNKHIHPGKPVSSLSTQRDAYKAIKFLHEFLEETVSVFRDYVIENGRLVPRPLD